MGRSAKLHKRFSRKERDFKKIVKNSEPSNSNGKSGAANATEGDSELEPEMDMPLSRAKKLKELEKAQRKKEDAEKKLHKVKAGKIAKPAPTKSKLPNLNGDDSDMDDADQDDEEVPWYLAEAAANVSVQPAGKAGAAKKNGGEKKDNASSQNNTKDGEGKPKGYILAGRKDYVGIFEKPPRKWSVAASKVVNFYPGRIL